jgi:phage FluMu gp28-like protein
LNAKTQCGDEKLENNRIGSEYYCGVDLGQKHDHSVIAVIEKKGDRMLLRFLKRFKLGTEYTSVLEYLKMLQMKFPIHALSIDRTGVGEVFMEITQNAGLHNAEGINLSLEKKQDVMTTLRQVMQEGRLVYPYDRDLFNELSVEIALFTETGKTKFSHRTGTHDDMLWALALAVYAARNQRKEIDYTVYFSKRPGEYPRPIVDWNQKGDVPPGNWATCMFCPRRRKPGTDCPCGHTKADGTQIPPKGGAPGPSWRGSPDMIGHFFHR